MPRPHVIQQADFPYHVSARCINKDWFSVPMDVVWHIMSTELLYISCAYHVKIHSFVLMNNHFHLLISTPEANLSEAMWSFMRQTSRFLTESGNRINQTYGNRHFRSLIQSSHYFMHAYKYIYANPLQAGLVKKCELYRYSTLHGLLGYEKLSVPVVEDTLLFENVEETLNWINTKPKPDSWEMVRRAMFKKEFKLAKDPQTKKESLLELEAL